MARDLYTAAMDFSVFGHGAISASNGMVFGGTLSGNYGFTTETLFHGLTNALDVDGKTILSLGAQLQSAVSGLTITFSLSTVKYTLSAAGNFTLNWQGNLGLELRDIFGFAANLSGASTYTSTQRPKYLIISRLAGQSQVHDLYEPAGRVAYAESDNGHAFSTHPEQMPLYRDWTQPFETLAGPTDAEYSSSSSVGGTAVRKRDVGSATKVTWTWQHFFEHCRATQPFVLVDRTTSVSGGGDVYKMRGEGAYFDPTRITADYDGHWTVPFVTRYIGAITVPPS